MKTRTACAPAYGPLLGLEAREASREENFSAWRAFLEGLAAASPTVIVVEDLHWADGALLAFMDYLAQSSAGVPLLVLATARPEVLELSGPGAAYVAATTRLALGPLSGEETAELARARLGAKSLPTDLQALILERSGGNPLFAEELVRLLEDRGLLESRGGKVGLRPGAEVPMPDSIGALIAARLDLLSAERKMLLADAAVVGRTFWAGAVAAVGELEPAAVLEGLMELVAKELVSPVRGSSIEGETEFLFVHALVCDVAYGQLTRADRAAKHAALARWLEERTAGRTEDLAEVLAYHYGTALELASSCHLELEDELMEPTNRYLALAGGRAAPLDTTAAAAHFARAEKVSAEAARPRRWLLSRRTRRKLRRRAPLLAGAAAVIAVAAVAALAIWAFMPPRTSGSAGASAAAKTMSPEEIVDQYGPSVVNITTRTPTVVRSALQLEAARGIRGCRFEGRLGSDERAAVRDQWHSQVAARLRHRRVRGPPGPVPQGRGVFLGSDPPGDLSVIKMVREDLRGARLQPVPLGDSESVHDGNVAVTLSRQGTYLASSTGEIQSVLRSQLNAPATQMAVVALSTTASLPKLATGGALIDSRGRLIGVMGDFYYDVGAAGLTGRQTAVAIGLFKQMVPNLQQANQAAPSSWLGVAGLSLTPSLASAAMARPGRGALIEFVVPRSPADKAGIVAGSRVTTIGGNQCVVGGDVIVGLNGVTIRSFEDLIKTLGRIDPGREVSVRLFRGRSPITLHVRLVPNPTQS